MIRLFLNDFQKAKTNDNPSVATLIYDNFLQQKTDETFFCFAPNISFAGSIQVDLIDCGGVVVRNIDGNFFYSEVNADIYFEFGNIGIDYYKRPLYLKITDLINDNAYYSNSFNITNYQSNLSSRFDFKNKADEYYQSVRIANCYHQDIEDKNEFSEYTQTNGKLVRYKNTTTNLNRCKIEKIDFYIGRWLNEIFNYDLIYLDSERVVISEYKQGTRKGDTNFLDADFLANLQNEFYNWDFQLYEGLQVIERRHFENNAIFGLPSDETNSNVMVFFNRNITNFVGNAYLQKHSDSTILPLEFELFEENFIQFNDLAILETLEDANGTWSVVINGQATAGNEVWNGFSFNEWNFTIASAEFDNTEFNNDFLI